MFSGKKIKKIQQILKPVHQADADEIIRTPGDQATHTNIAQRARLGIGKLSVQDAETLQLSLNNRTLLSLLGKSRKMPIRTTQPTALQSLTVQQNIVMRDPDPPHKLVAATDRVKKGTGGSMTQYTMI